MQTGYPLCLPISSPRSSRVPSQTHSHGPNWEGWSWTHRIASHLIARMSELKNVRHRTTASTYQKPEPSHSNSYHRDDDYKPQPGQQVQKAPKSSNASYKILLALVAIAGACYYASTLYQNSRVQHLARERKEVSRTSSLELIKLLTKFGFWQALFERGETWILPPRWVEHDAGHALIVDEVLPVCKRVLLFKFDK